MTFDYLIQVKKQEQIDIDNVGKFALNVFNDLGFEWLLIASTKEGFVEMIEYGPIIAESDVLPSSVCYYYERFEFKQKKVATKIDKFLNDYGKGITQAFEISVDEAKEIIKSRKDLIDIL